MLFAEFTLAVGQV